MLSLCNSQSLSSWVYIVGLSGRPSTPDPLNLLPKWNLKKHGRNNPCGQEFCTCINSGYQQQCGQQMSTLEFSLLRLYGKMQACVQVYKACLAMASCKTATSAFAMLNPAQYYSLHLASCIVLRWKPKLSVKYLLHRIAQKWVYTDLWKLYIVQWQWKHACGNFATSSVLFPVWVQLAISKTKLFLHSKGLDCTHHHR